MSKLNENIRKFRELRRLTQKDFSDRVKKSDFFTNGVVKSPNLRYTPRPLK